MREKNAMQRTTDETPGACHGEHAGMRPGSELWTLSGAEKCYWRLWSMRIHAMWRLRTQGVLPTLKVGLRKLLGISQTSSAPTSAAQPLPAEQEVLHLRPGEWVEVKSEQEILANLDGERRYKGLMWMAGMRKFCGRRFRVHKRVERILLEGTGEYRKLKNTVLLEGVMCDGVEWNGCDRSCFHFWREAWLRRVTGPGTTSDAKSSFGGVES
jgi:hypothetical protein